MLEFSNFEFNFHFYQTIYSILVFRTSKCQRPKNSDWKEVVNFRNFEIIFIWVFKDDEITLSENNYCKCFTNNLWNDFFFSCFFRATKWPCPKIIIVNKLLFFKQILYETIYSFLVFLGWRNVNVRKRADVPTDDSGYGSGGSGRHRKDASPHLVQQTIEHSRWNLLLLSYKVFWNSMHKNLVLEQLLLQFTKPWNNV